MEVNHDTELRDLRVKTSHGVQVIHTTASHLFWDPYLKQWRPAAQLKKGEHFRTADGTTATADGGTAPADHDGWMWDITVPCPRAWLNNRALANSLGGVPPGPNATVGDLLGMVPGNPQREVKLTAGVARSDADQKGGPGTIKLLSEDELDQLMRKAAVNKWSAEGRPDWFRQHRSQFKVATLIVFGTEGSSRYRCIATVVLRDGSGGRFTLDVEVRDYDALKDLDDHGTVVMAHRYLATFPAVDLDDAQAKTWDRSVSKRWGEPGAGQGRPPA